jgi:uncharacterized membrane protein YidH (DUF202 family)
MYSLIYSWRLVASVLLVLLGVGIMACGAWEAIALNRQNRAYRTDWLSYAPAVAWLVVTLVMGGVMISAGVHGAVKLLHE